MLERLWRIHAPTQQQMPGFYAKFIEKFGVVHNGIEVSAKIHMDLEYGRYSILDSILTTLSWLRSSIFWLC